MITRAHLPGSHLPIVQVKPDLKDAVRMAVAAIDRFLAMFYPPAAIRQTQAALAIAGQWLSRVPGFHEDDDFLYLVRDFLAFVLSGGERSLVSDQLVLFFSGFMPSYGAARTFLGIVADGGTWTDVRAFMHSQAYGNAQAYVETFDWTEGNEKARAEIKAWLKVLTEQDDTLRIAGTQLAFVPPMPGPGVPAPPVTDVLPAAEPAAETLVEVVAAVEASPALASVGVPLLAGVALMSVPENIFKPNHEPVPAPAPAPKKIVIPATKTQTTVQTDTTNNECKKQLDENQKNGKKCEEDGYVIMEKVLDYKRLADPPKGRGLDGLFEKLAPMNAPNPMPKTVKIPARGRLEFIPESARPPKPVYNYVHEGSRPAAPVYPEYVVFEAKNISKWIDPDDHEEIKKEAKRRLGDTCDGIQMSNEWVESGRILSRLKRSGMNEMEQQKKYTQIQEAGYARWIFLCLPGPVGSSSKVYVLIDVVEADMGLDGPKLASIQSSDNMF